MQSEMFLALVPAWRDIFEGEILPGIERHVDQQRGTVTPWKESSPIDDHWVPLFQNSESWCSLASDISTHLVTHSRAPIDDASVDITNWETWSHASYNSAIQLAMCLLYSVCDACRHEFQSYLQQDTEPDKLIIALNSALPKISTQDGHRIESRMCREWTLWDEQDSPSDPNKWHGWNPVKKYADELGRSKSFVRAKVRERINSDTVRRREERGDIDMLESVFEELKFKT